MLWTGHNPDGTGGVNSYADLLDWRARAQSFEALAAYNISFMTMTGVGDPEEVHGATVTPEFFRVLRARFILGRGIEAGDELVDIDKGRPIVISYGLWTRRYNADPGILEHTITLGNRQRRVVGILSRDFVHPEPFWDAHADYFVPLPVAGDLRTNHANHFIRVIGRLKPGVTIAQAQSEMDGIGRDMMRTMPVSNTASVVVDRLQDDLVGDTRPLALMFLGASILVLSLAVANIVNLLLARVNRRRTEFAIRTALGASGGRLVTQLVMESTIVGLVGGLAGLGLARLAIQAVVAIAPSNVLGLEHAGIDLGVVAFTALLSAATGALCGVLPAWRVARARLSGTLVNSRGSSGLEVSRMRTWLIAAELALALPLLVGAGLLTETLVHLQRVNLGFDPSHTVQFRVSLTGARYAKPDAEVAYFDDLTRQLAAAPGVRSAGAISSLPLGGLNNTAGSIVYRRADGSDAETNVGFRVGTGGYFASLGIPLRRGRLFTIAPEDTKTIVVNDRAAAVMWGEADPIGQQLRLGRLGDVPGKDDWLTVIGVVGSLRHERVSVPPSAEVFQPYQANTWGTMTVVARTEGDPAALMPEVRRIVRDLDPKLAVVNLTTMSSIVDAHLERPRFGVEAAGVLGSVGLLLAAFGMFAVLSLLVAQRTREIGIRMALGSTARDIGALLVRESLLPIVTGCALGAAAAFSLTRLLSSQLFGVTERDPTAFVVALVVLLGTVIVAIWRPARRAMGIDPMKALRAD
jgi:predicted permease